MEHDLELVLRTRDHRWVAEGPGVSAEAATIPELDEAVRAQLAASGRYPRGSRVTVLMACDRAVIPEWMRPYQQHYFNRAVSFVV